MAGTADIGIPNGMRLGLARRCHQLSACGLFVDKVHRMDEKVRPKKATDLTFGDAGPVPAQGQIAQQIFVYTAFTADIVKPGLPVVNADVTPKWRMVPGPNRLYLK